jgi:glycine cleavage system H lipoate-binding protein
VLTSNRALYDDPSLLNSDPYGQPLVVLTIAEGTSPAEGLLDAAAYAALIGSKE